MKNAPYAPAENAVSDGENKIRMLRPVLWMAAFLGDLLLVFFFQVGFVHTVPSMAARDLAKLPFFENGEILDVGGTLDGGGFPFWGQDTPTWLLYRTGGGELRAVRLQWNLYAPRFKIEKNTVQTIPDGEGEYTFTARNFLGTDTVTVQDGTHITFRESGAYRQQTHIEWGYVLSALALLLAEGGIALFVQKQR